MPLVACFIKEGFMKKKSIRLSYSYIITAVICALALLFSFAANSFALTSRATAQSTQQSQNNKQTNTPPLKQTDRSTTQTNNTELQSLKPLDENIYGKVDVSKWTVTVNGTSATIESYNGDKKHVVVPTLADLKDDTTNGSKYKGVTSLSIAENTLSGLIDKNQTDTTNNTKTIAISHNGNPVNMPDTNLSYLFASTKLTHIDLANLHTGRITGLHRTFFDNGELQTIKGIENWDVSTVTSLEELFSQCYVLVDLPNLSSWNTSKVTNMDYVFNGLKIVPDKDFGFLSKWKTDNVTTMDSMLAQCYELRSVEPLKNWNTAKVTIMKDMFYAADIRDLSPLANWNVKNVTNMQQMFISNYNLEDFSGLGKWQLNHDVNMNRMFSKLTGTLIAKDWKSVTSYKNSPLFIKIINNMAQGEEQGPYNRSGIGAIFITDGPFVKEIKNISGFHHCVRLYHSRKDYDDKKAPFATIKMPVVYYSTSIDASNKDAQRNVVLAEAQKKVNNWIKEKEKKDNKKYVITDTIFDKFKNSYNDAHLTANASFVIEEVKYKKTITQTITVHDQPGELEYTIIRKREIHRTLKTDSKGNKVLSPWSKAVFEKFTLPQIKGYSVMPVEKASTTVNIKDDVYYVQYNKQTTTDTGTQTDTPETTDTGTGTDTVTDTPETTDTGTQTDPEPQKSANPDHSNVPDKPNIIYVQTMPNNAGTQNQKDQQNNDTSPACNCDCSAKNIGNNENKRNNQSANSTSNASHTEQNNASKNLLAATGSATQYAALLSLFIATSVGSFSLGKLRFKKRKHAIK